MSYIVYGLRLKGDTEARYIGMTGYNPESRLKRLTLEARLYGRRPTTGFHGWLNINRGSIEAFEIERAATKADAHEAERRAVSFCLTLNHRLFNSWLVPAQRRAELCLESEAA